MKKFRCYIDIAVLNISLFVSYLLLLRRVYNCLLERRRLRQDAHTVAVGARGVVVGVDRHVDVPLVCFEKIEVEAGEQGGDAHIEFCVCETGVV